MITLLKEERIAIVDKAIRILIEGIATRCICGAISHSSDLTIPDVFNYFPELLKYKPKKMHDDDFWFDLTRENIPIRVEILKKVRQDIELSID